MSSIYMTVYISSRISEIVSLMSMFIALGGKGVVVVGAVEGFGGGWGG